MGMYTGLRCKVIIKPEYIVEFVRLHSKEVYYDWSTSNIDFLKEYYEYPRADWVPNGCLSYMPVEWEDSEKKATDGFDTKFESETGLWSFQCSLKNYDDTIEYFFEHVLSKVTQEVIHLEYYYEEWTRSKFYELINGKIVESDKEGIKYGYEENDGYEG